jgi:hypothetical protein
MADAAAISALISGLGGAVIGAGATVFVSARQSRREKRERDQDLGRVEARAEIVRLTSLRFAGRAWLDTLLRAHQSLQAGATVNLQQFDDDVKEAGGQATLQGYSVVIAHPSVDDLAGAISDQLSDLTWQLRGEILAAPGDDGPMRLDLDVLGTQLQRVGQQRADLNVKLIERIAELALGV